MGLGGVMLAGGGTVAAGCALFAMGANDAAVISSVGPVSLLLPITALFELVGASLAGQNITGSLPNKVAANLAVDDSVGSTSCRCPVLGLECYLFSIARGHCLTSPRFSLLFFR
jgi:hypothetical protein